MIGRNVGGQRAGGVGLVPLVRLNAAQAQQREMATAGELLANAVASVGLPLSGSPERDARTAAQAIGNGKIPTPEMYVLLHAAASSRRLGRKTDDDTNH